VQSTGLERSRISQLVTMLFTEPEASIRERQPCL
jgi:hypothetical protein